MPKTKNLISIGLVFLLIVSSTLLTFPRLTAASGITVSLNGEPLTFDQGVIIKDGRALVPMRKIFEALDATVHYDSETKVVIAERNDLLIELPIGSKHVKVNDRDIEIDVASQVVNGRTLVPLRFISESLGADVHYDSQARHIFIMTVAIEPSFFYMDTSANISEHIDYEQFEAQFSNTHTDQELVGMYLIEDLIGHKNYVETHQTTSLELDGELYDFYMITFSELDNNKATGEFAIEVYDIDTGETVDEIYGQMSDIAFDQNLKFTIPEALEIAGQGGANSEPSDEPAEEAEPEKTYSDEDWITSYDSFITDETFRETLLHPTEPILYTLDDNGLVVIDLTDQSVEHVTLPLPAERMDLYDDKLYITMLTGEHSPYRWEEDQSGEIAVVNINTLNLSKRFEIDIDPYGVVADENYLYVQSGSGQWTDIQSLDKDTGALIDSTMIRERSINVMHPDMNRIYTMTTDSSPKEYKSYHIKDGQFTDETRWPYHGGYTLANYYDISSDGKYIFNGSGGVFHATQNSDTDMTHVTSLSTTFTSIAFGLEQNKFFTAKDQTVTVYDYSTFTKENELTLNGDIRHLFYQDQTLYVVTYETPSGSNLPKFVVHELEL
ncbi:copper amine oxidase N-terminal domain-containing protein [Caldalkalibacillus salinus]|uniref:copper amine oxidase N-terminal domain-containing protein n=1 Tax=Caldalkalibacillus salinus TaxID=2803787 RepID=UPI001922796F|nr:copper amine oxidase N-terminal domain-containing protein [Caldalkalibacillus salinus]